MNIFRFLDWKMYQDARGLNQKITQLSRSLNSVARYKYEGQINRAALSVCLNIAEGSGRHTDLDMCRFFDIALGSLAELIACIDNLLAEKIIEKTQFESFYQESVNISKQIQGMQFQVKKSIMIKSRKKEIHIQTKRRE